MAESAVDATATPPTGGGRPAMFGDAVLTKGCPSRAVLDHITSKWGVLVLVALAGGTLRWSGLRRIVQGVSEKMLAQTLQTLERDGFVRRDAQPTIPPRVDYSLTDRGNEVVRLLLPLMEWLGANAAEIIDQAGHAAPGS